MNDEQQSFEKQLDTLSKDKLQEVLEEMLPKLQRQLDETGGASFVIKQLNREQKAMLFSAVLNSGRKPGSGDAVDFVRECFAGPHGNLGVHRALMEIVGVDDPNEFNGPDEEYLSEEETAINFIRGAMKVWYSITEGEPLSE